MILVAALVLGIEGVIVNYNVQQRETDHQLVISYTNPCLDLEDNLAKQPDKSFDAKTHERYANAQCQQHFRDDWIFAVYNLSKCLPRLHKRSVLANPKLLRAATNLVTSAFFRKGTQAAPSNVRSNHQITSSINVNVMRDVFTNTNNVINVEAKEQELKHFPLDTFSSYQAHRSIARKSALLRSITETCQKTRELNTRAVQALLDTDDSMGYQQDGTKMTKVDVDMKKGEITITFDYIRVAVGPGENGAPLSDNGTKASPEGPADKQQANEKNNTSLEVPADQQPPKNREETLLTKQNIIFLCLNLMTVVILFTFFMCFKRPQPVAQQTEIEMDSGSDYWA